MRHFDADLGVCYFPEHWDPSTHVPDAKRMKALGLRTVRIGEFSWSVSEPGPGAFDPTWLQDALDTLHAEGLEVVLCTPTATPPKWLVDEHPDILPVGEDGHVRRFGSRRHYCFTSPTYRRETRRIVAALADRFGQHPAVVAWQLDNEYGCHDTTRCYCDRCAAGFRDWLRERYGTVDALNDAWWTRFWSQVYRDFDEIDPPNRTVTEPNPSHRLDYYRFASDQVIAYNRLQAEIVRARSPGRPLLHNSMGFFFDYDHAKLAEDLDRIGWDNYPLGGLEVSPHPTEVKERFLRAGDPDMAGFNHDLYRGLKDRPFWVVEQQPGQVNWAPSNPLPGDGAVRMWTHQAFAHGAEVVSYFRWRAAVGAQELMHAGLLQHDGSDDQAAREAALVRRELDAAPAPSRPARVALVLDYESAWATELQPHAEGWSYAAALLAFYTPLRSLAVDVDVVPVGRDLDRYDVAVAPALHLVDEERAAWLARWVEGGGHLVLGPRSGAKTMSNLAHQPAPGPLRELAGVRIERVDGLRPGIEREVVVADEVGETRLAYGTWADLLVPEDAEVRGVYADSAYRGAAAWTHRTHGRGSCTVLGALGGPALVRRVLEPVLHAADVAHRLLPPGVRSSRVGRPALVNFTSEPVELDDPNVTVAPYGVHLFGAED